jgi:Zn-dependent protease with chaperone function
VRRVFWGLVGVGLGAALGIALARWTSRTRERYAPGNLAREAAARAAGLAERLRRAVEAGREAMEAREAELRAELGLPER